MHNLRLAAVTSAPSSGAINIDATGRIGIATTSPAHRLSLGSDLVSTKLAIWDGGTGSSFGLGVQSQEFRFNLNTTTDHFSFLNGEAGSELVRILGNGNVGIGTTAPTQRLDLGGGNISMGYEIITSALCTTSTTGWASCTATCSAGKQALGGSCGTGCCTRAAEYTTITSTSYTCGIYQTNGAYGFNATVVCANIK